MSLHEELKKFAKQDLTAGQEKRIAAIKAGSKSSFKAELKKVQNTEKKKGVKADSEKTSAACSPSGAYVVKKKKKVLTKKASDLCSLLKKIAAAHN